ncbi:MAG: AAA family ATPase [Candidatus Competibacterales bacterium]
MNRASIPLPEVEALRQRLNRLRRHLSQYFVAKDEVVDLMVLCTLVQEPLLLVGKPGTGKSDLVVKFCQALGLGDGEYFEYMLTKFTEPGEILGPVDINLLKEGRYWRRTAAKLPEARVVFLDEIFKSNSAILNTLLTVINERKFYQDGQPVAIPMVMLFAAANEIPEFGELAALVDRFVLKVESEPVRETHFEDLIDKGLRNEGFRVFNQRPWVGQASLDDFIALKAHFDRQLLTEERLEAGPVGDGFPEGEFLLFKRILNTLAKEDRISVTDRKVIKLYKLLRAWAFLDHGGGVRRADLRLLRYIADRLQDFAPVREKVDSLLQLD